MKYPPFLMLVLVLSACSRSHWTEAPASDVELQQKLVGSWRADVQLPKGIHVQSETIVDSGGGYIFHCTNTLADGVRIGTLAGTLQVRNGLLIDTITNDFGSHSLIPRIGDVTRIIRVDEHELTVRSTNSDETITYQKDSR